MIALHCEGCGKVIRGLASTYRNTEGQDVHAHLDCAFSQARPAIRGNTPRRSIRIPDDLWTGAQIRAVERGETVTDAITRALQRYVR